MKLQIISLAFSSASLPVGFVIAEIGWRPGVEGIGIALFSVIFMIVGLLIGFTTGVVAACLPTGARTLSFASIPLPIILGLCGIPALLGR
jgi:hypothetical protein